MQTTTPTSEINWHALTTAETLQKLKVNIDRGLDNSEIIDRQVQFGKNILASKKPQPLILKFLHQFNQAFIYILIFAGTTKAILGQWVNAGVIWGVTTTNAFIGFLQESKAEGAISALAQSVVTEATVIRNGQKLRIPSTELVVGDVVWLASGDKVPADLRLIQVRDLQINESGLTGESVPVEKISEVIEPEAPISDRDNIAYAGGFVTFGQGIGVVIAVGTKTETGKISNLMESRLDLTTPLTRKFNQFSQNWLLFVMFAAVMTFAVGLDQRGFAGAMEAAVALTVGAIPEGLPAVITVTLAVGVSRMAQRNAIIRKLPAVETLGGATVICSDKTGTLTQNQMTVQQIWAGDKLYEVTGSGYSTEGMIESGGSPISSPNAHPELTECLLAGFLCNDTEIETEGDKHKVVGDPTEAALLVSARKGIPGVGSIASAYPRIDTIPFESQFQYMVTLHRRAEENLAYVKGSVEAILERSDVDSSVKSVIHEQVDAMAKQGLRVLAFAKKSFAPDHTSVSHEDIKTGLEFIGLQASIDPPRPEAISAVRVCQQAGVQVKMITGDHIVTAKAIAKRMGFRRGRNITAYTGAELAEMSSDALEKAVVEGTVFARVAPEQKLRIVEALQRQGEVVAMTGDGVNDAPALKQADIGIAMGSGTEVAKEASDAILTDDNFASIESAIEEGRSVYKNLAKAISFILPVNGGESMTILISTLLGRELPILSLQILWLNMLNSITMTVPLSLEPSSPDVMKQPPRPVGEQFLTARRVKRIIAVSLYNWTLIFGMFEWVGQSEWGSLPLARTMSIQALVIARIFYLLSISQLLPALRERWSGKSSRNAGAPAVFAGVLVAMVLQIIFSNSQFINEIFGTAPMSLDQWMICLLAGLPMIGVAASANRIDPPN